MTPLCSGAGSRLLRAVLFAGLAGGCVLPAMAAVLRGGMVAGGGHSTDGTYALHGALSTGLAGHSRSDGVSLLAGYPAALPPPVPYFDPTLLLANDDTAQVVRGGSVSALAGGASRLIDNDQIPEGAAVTLRLVSRPDHGVVTVEPDGRFRYDHNGTEAEMDQFRYAISTPTQDSVATVRVSITPADDAQPPLAIDAPADLTVVATGYWTPVVLGSPDVVAPADATVSASGRGPFRVGHHDIIWQLQDAAGRRVLDLQRVTILPTLQLLPDGTLTEGTANELTLVLSDVAPDYPVTATFSVGGTATPGEDHDLEPAAVRFEQGTTLRIAFDVVADALVDPDETLTVSLGDVVGAGLSARTMSTDRIVEGGLPPAVVWSVQQEGLGTRRLRRDGGIVRVQASVIGADAPYAADWSESQPKPADLDGREDDLTLEFDPLLLPAGLLKLRLVVIDAAVRRTPFELALRLVESAPELSEDDTDGDGLPDAIEGDGDADFDGLPDWRDAEMPLHVMALTAGGDTVMETEPGLSLRLGAAAFEIDAPGPLLAEEALARLGIVDVPPIGLGRVYDYQITGLRPGASARVVLPVSMPLPERAVMRKWVDGRWIDFAERQGDLVRSAPAVDDVCPGAGHPAYQVGLWAGNACIELQLRDGGPNDADGVANGVIDDPVAIGLRDAGGGGAWGLGVIGLLLAALLSVRRRLSGRSPAPA